MANNRKTMKPPTPVTRAVRNIKNDVKSAANGLSNIWNKPGSSNNSRRVKPK